MILIRLLGAVGIIAGLSLLFDGRLLGVLVLVLGVVVYAAGAVSSE